MHPCCKEGKGLKRLSTVRLEYLYIFGGSVLLSGVSLFAVYRLSISLYSRYGSGSAALFVRLVHWVINHFGKIPAAAILFSLVFCGFFLLRSHKLSKDLRSLVQATRALAEQGFFGDLKVVSGGEVGQMAASLQQINQRGLSVSSFQEDHTPHSGDLAASENMSGVTPIATEEAAINNGEAMAMILRIKSLIRLLEEARLQGDQETEVHRQIEKATHEAREMERALESLIAE
jgi:hypothetical protein